MAGEAKTTKFALGTATVMFGPQAEVFDLNPADHGVGLTKSVSVTSEPSFVDLTQGVKNKNVYSVMNGNVVNGSMEVYEYTAQNLTYAAGLDGTNVVTPTGSSTIASPVSASDTSVEVQTGDASNFSEGDWLIIENGAQDKVYARKIASINLDVLTLSGDALPDAIPAGEKVRAVSMIEVGSKEDQPFLGCKIVGTLADGSTAGLVFPKVRITNGFNISFLSDDYQNMPFEISMYDLVTSDPLYSTFGGAQGMALL